MSVLTSSERLVKILQAEPEKLEAIDRILTGEPPPRPRVLDAPALLGTCAAAKVLGVSRGTLWRMLRHGTIRKIPLFPGSYRILRAELEDFLEEGRAK